jgi:hypothetical protein
MTESVASRRPVSPLCGVDLSYQSRSRQDRICAGFRMTAHYGRCHRRRGRRPKAFREGNRDEGCVPVQQALSYGCLERLHNFEVTARMLHKRRFHVLCRL